MKCVVDRIENNIAVCETEGRKMVEIPLENFAVIPKDGDVVFWENGVVIIDKFETIKKKNEAQSLFDRLKKK